MAIDAQLEGNDATIESDQNVLQKHVAFFDRNNDGVVYPWETYQGCREIGIGITKSAFLAVLINVRLSGSTRPGKMCPNLLFPVVIQNINMSKHPSDSGVYDIHGRFVVSKFEDIFRKYAHTNPDYLTQEELKEFIRGNRVPKDYLNWIVALAEWKLLYSVAKDQKGLLQKDTVKSVFDGSLFEKLARDQTNLSKKEHL